MSLKKPFDQGSNPDLEELRDALIAMKIDGLSEEDLDKLLAEGGVDFESYNKGLDKMLEGVAPDGQPEEGNQKPITKLDLLKALTRVDDEEIEEYMRKSPEEVDASLRAAGVDVEASWQRTLDRVGHLMGDSETGTSADQAAWDKMLEGFTPPSKEL